MTSAFTWPEEGFKEEESLIRFLSKKKRSRKSVFSLPKFAWVRLINVVK
jgi:hypothetical protein